MVDNETLAGVTACCHDSTSINRRAELANESATRPTNESGENVAEWLLAELTDTLTNGTAQLAGNGTISDDWDSNVTSSFSPEFAQRVPREYWALVLVLFPIFTVFGNVLVILSVYKERNLQSVTNYFIVSLAVADLLVAALVMPFAVYVLVNINWELSSTLCDFYIAMDVICSTSSIFNLVAISIDRYIAVNQPIKYARHTNNKRVVMTIAIVWVVSAAIGSPIVLGLNTAPDKDPTLCIFYNADFIIYSSLSSFYIPCIMMVYLYYRIFRAIRARALAAKKKKSMHHSDYRPETVIEKVTQTKKLQETTLLATDKINVTTATPATATTTTAMTVADPPTDNPTESGSHDDDDEDEEQQQTPASEDCHIIPNDKSTEFMLNPVREDTIQSRGNDDDAVINRLTSTGGETNGNNDSGYAASAKDETPPAQKPLPSSPVLSVQLREKSTLLLELPTAPPSVALSPPRSVSRDRRNGSATPLAEESPAIGRGRQRAKKTRQSKKPRFTLARAHRSSCKKKERSSAKKERKATKTLAIVLGVFLICWVPFFTCNIMDALCTKLQRPECQPSITTFLLTTWLGYMNSFINPVIYTIFNTEFRKAFKKILTCG